MFKKELLKALSDIAIGSPIVGVTTEDIVTIEESENVTLPEVYKSFLLIAGSSKNRLLVDAGFMLYPDSLGT